MNAEAEMKCNRWNVGQTPTAQATPCRFRVVIAGADVRAARLECNTHPEGVLHVAARGYRLSFTWPGRRKAVRQ